MTAVGDESSSLASKCLDLCQTLASQGQAFTFSLTIGSTFNFSMSTGSQDSPAPAPKVEKRKSPSARRRNARRRKEFLKRKSGLPSPTSLKPAKDSTDVTLAGLDAMVPSSANVMNVEVDEELFSSPLEEDEDDSDSDDSMEEEDNKDLPSKPPFCFVCKAHSYPPHRVRAVSDLILGMISQGKGDPVGLIKSILYCDKHTVTSNSPPVCDLLM